MKKTFFLTLAVLGLLVSSCKEEPYYESNPNQEKYTHVFIRQFGLIDVDNDWGFSPARERVSDPAPASRAVSRNTGSHINVNGNEWKNPPLIKEWERRAVMEYLHKHGTTGNVGDLGDKVGSAFFVTQVGNCSHTFDESYVFSYDKNGTNGRIHGQYQPENHASTFSSWDKMNNLHVAFASEYSMSELGSGSTADGTTNNWTHIYNFNRCENANHQGNTVVLGDGAYHFAYDNSLADKYQDNYIVIPGWLIDFRLASYYYVCFDYVSDKGAATVFDIVYTDANTGTDQTAYSVNVPGYFKDGQGITEEALGQGLKNQTPSISYSKIKSWTFRDQYQQLDKLVYSDGVYDDWVIRICGNAIRKDDPRMPSYPYEDYEAFRIFVEDLSVAAGNSLSSSASDWDFNDLVFDAKILQTEGHEDVSVTLRALGGTLPIFIEDAHGNRTKELHSYFEDSPCSVMINTGAGKNYSPVTINLTSLGMDFDIDFSKMEEFSVTQGQGTLSVRRVPAIEYNKLKVVVKIGGSDYSMDLMELEAERGQAPSKLCVPSYLAHPMERILITDTYPRFTGYVQGEYPNFWETALNSTDFWGKENSSNN